MKEKYEGGHFEKLEHLRWFTKTLGNSHACQVSDKCA